MPVAFVSRHRRPSRILHRADLEESFRRKKTPVMVPDGDTFYFNQAYVSEWAMAPELWARLPSWLTSELPAWQAAGAAVLTVLARYDSLEREAPSRGWPEKTHSHLSRTTSHASPAIRSPIPPVIEAALSEGVDFLPPLQSKFRRDSKGTMPAAIDTPPFTPQDNTMGDQHHLDISATSLINDTALAQVNSRLSSMAITTACDTSGRKVSEPSPSITPSSRRGSAESQSTVSVFDEPSWDIYINSCKAELAHLRSETLVRFRHLGRGIDRLCVEMKAHTTQPMHVGIETEFRVWWKQMMDKALDYESEVRALDLPDLEEVKAERLAQGLSI